VASDQQLSFNLGLGATPEVAADPQTFQELIRMYNAIRILGAYVDQYTGNAYHDPAVYFDYTPQDTVLVGNTAFVYAKLTEAIATAGTIVTFGSEAVTNVLTAGLNSSATPARGMTMEQGKLAGEYTKILLFGLFPYASGLLSGATYYAHLSIPGAFTITPGGQVLGVALSGTSLFFNPHPESAP